MSWSEEDRAVLGELKAHVENTKDGINRIENSMTTFSQNVREDIINLHRKNDKAHERIDRVAGDFKSHKAKVTGFAAAISAVWAVIMGWVKD